MEAVPVEILNEKGREDKHACFCLLIGELGKQMLLQGRVMVKNALDKVAVLVAFIVGSRLDVGRRRVNCSGCAGCMTGSRMISRAGLSQPLP